MVQTASGREAEAGGERMNTINWQKVLLDVFTDDPSARIGRSDQPGRFGILGPRISLTRDQGGDHTSICAYPQTPADHFRIAGALNAIGLQLDGAHEIPEDAEPLEIPYSQLAHGTVKDLVEWAENYGFLPSELMELLQDHPDAVDLLDNN